MPNPIPAWGRVVAAPHEYLVHIRRGRIRTQGRGASCFKWPSDAVALVPTSIGKLAFVADQVTREKVGVEVTGLAVYRIVEPLVAYQMIDGDLQKLTDVLRDMFVGATRRIVATLSLEECMTHRKERVAFSLMSEIAPVLSGQGAPDDTTRMGWGVIIDTIEIQNVRVLSDEVFQRIQAPFRERLALEAMIAHDKVEEERARLETERARAAEEARRSLMEVERERMEEERAREERERAHQLRLEESAIQASIRFEDERRRAARRAADLDQEAEIERGRRALAADEERSMRAREVERRAAELELDLRDKRSLLDNEVVRRQRELEQSLLDVAQRSRVDLTEAQLRETLLTETMPRMAEAFRGSFDRITLHQSDHDGDGVAAVAHLLRRVLLTVKEVDRDTATGGPVPERRR